jgi:hypothetical protein
MQKILSFTSGLANGCEATFRFLDKEANEAISRFPSTVKIVSVTDTLYPAERTPQGAMIRSPFMVRVIIMADS